MTYRIRASQTARPNTAAGKCDIAPASVLKRKVHAILNRTIAFMTANPQTSERFQKARANAANEKGTTRAMSIFQSVQLAVRYSLSETSISFTAELECSGEGNQNILVASATTVSTMPQRLRL